MTSILGIDVAKDSLAVHLVQGEATRAKSFLNCPDGHRKLCRWLQHQDVTELHVCLEATNVYHLGVATALYLAGYTVYVANPWSVKQYAKAVMKRSKTDPVDAKLLASYCRANDALHPWSPLPPEREELRRLTRHRQSLLRENSRLSCQLKSQASPAVQASLERQIAFIEGEVTQVEQAIEAHFKAHPELGEKVKHLRSIPGISKVSSAVILAELGKFERFDHSGEVAAYAGLTPQAHQSGTSVRGQEVLCKLGNKRLRTALYWPAVVLLRCKTLYRDFIEERLAKGREKMTIIAALMRKLLCLAYGVLRSGRPYDPAYDGSGAVEVGGEVQPCGVS